MPEPQLSATNGRSGGSFVRAAIVGLFTLLLPVLGASGAWAAGQPFGASAQRSPGTAVSSTTRGSTPVTPTTSANLLTGTTVAATSTTVAAPEESPATQVNDDNRRVWLVVAGLVVVAILLALLTLRFWMRTRPAHVADDTGRRVEGADDVEDGEHHDELAHPSPRTNGSTRASSLGGLDHDGAEEDWSPRDRRRRERLEPARPGHPVRPGRPQREASLRRGTEPPT